MARSADLGRTWTATFLGGEIEGVEGFIRAVGFATAEKGWAVGGRGFVSRTLDGGETWTRQVGGIELPEAATARGVWFDSVAFLDEQRGVIVGIGQTDEVIGVFGPSRIYRTERVVLLTEDGGETWRPAPIDGDRSTGSVNSACFTGSGVGLIAGGPTLLSLDGGRTWSSIDDRLPYSGWRHAECHGEDTLWLGTVDFVRSDDAGATWTKLTPEEGLGFTCCGGAADFVTDNIGWSFTEELLKTVDGGSTWTPVETPPRPGAFTIIEFVTPEIGVWAGNGGAWVTHDGGESWFFTVMVPLDLEVQISDIVVVE